MKVKEKYVVYDFITKETSVEEIEVEKELFGESNIAPYTLEERVDRIEALNSEQDNLIETVALAVDRVLAMLEPLQTKNTVSVEEETFVSMYVAMVQRGLKKVEEVPTRYKEEVVKTLEK